MKKSKYEAEKDRVRLLQVIDALDRHVDRTLIHALLPNISYGTISGRLVDLVNAGLLEEDGENEYYVPHLRSGLNLSSTWNPRAASDATFANGAQFTKRYRKTAAWSWLSAYKALKGKVDQLGK